MAQEAAAAGAAEDELLSFDPPEDELEDELESDLPESLFAASLLAGTPPPLDRLSVR